MTASGFEARVNATIDSTLAPFNLIIREIARPRLQGVATFCSGYTIRTDTSLFDLQCDTVQHVTVTFGAPEVPGTAPDGHPFMVRGQREGGVVTLQFVGEGGWQRTRYEVVSTELHADKTVHAEQLGADVAWGMR